MVAPNDLEEWVVLFLEQHEVDPALLPADFIRGYPLEHRPALRAAIQKALEIEATLSRTAGEHEDRPEWIGPYRVKHELGRGGMGVVYLAEKGGRDFALKVLPSSSRGDERFFREVNALARIDHPNVVTILDSGSHQGAPYLVMEYLEGVLLSQCDALPPERAVRIVAELAAAVAAVHDAGILHRDLKPQNVMLRDGEQPVLLDFGLVTSEDDDSLTASGAVLGTPLYMAPEQASAEEADARTDVFALGLILYELLHGQPARPSGSRSRVIAHIEQRDPKVPSAWHRDLRRLLAATLARDRRDRPASVQAFRDELGRIQRGEPVRCGPPPAWRRVGHALKRRPIAVGLAGSALLLGALLPYLKGDGTALSASERTRLEFEVDRALSAWLLGGEVIAAKALEEALRIAPEDGRALALEVVLAPDSPNRTAFVAEILAEDSAESVIRAVLDLRNSERDDREQVRVALEVAERFPTSGAVACAAAERLQSAGENEAAESVLSRALETHPNSPFLCKAMTALLIEEGRPAEALRFALRAAENATALGGQPGFEFARLIANIGSFAEVTAELRAFIDSGADGAEVWFALGYYLDSEHLLEEAAHAYAEAVAKDPQHFRANLNLAHLYGGAQLGGCDKCDSSYGAAPHMLDPERAIARLGAALRIDRGSSDVGIARIVQTAMDVRKRAPEAGSLRSLEAFLLELSEEEDLSAGARARIDEGLVRVRMSREDG